MAMSKENYEAVVRLVGEVKAAVRDCNVSAVDAAVEELADVFAVCDLKFDKSKFLAACRVVSA